MDLEELLRFYYYDPDHLDRSEYHMQMILDTYQGNTQTTDEPYTQYIQNATNPAMVSCVDPKNTPWPMKSHDNHHTGLSPYTTIHITGATLWSFYCDPVKGGAAIDIDGTIYFGDVSGYLYALHSNGSLKWRFACQHFGGSFTSTPCIGPDGTIYIGSWDHYFYAINPDGTLKWKKEIGTTTSSPAVDSNGAIYTGTMGNMIYAFNQDGTVKWSYRTDYKITSDPAIADDGTVYIGSGDGYLYAMNPNGTVKWKFETGHYIKGPPSIDEDGTIYIGSYDGNLYALLPNGTMKWQCPGAATETTPAIGPDGTIYVGDDKLYAINPWDGSYKWNLSLGYDQDIFQSSPAASADGIIYVGTHIDETKGGDLIAVNQDGTLRWRIRLTSSGWVDSSPCIGSDGTVYIGTYGRDGNTFVGQLYAIGPGDVNYAPDAPTIDGPTSGKIGREYAYTFSTVDPEDDQIELYVDWGDNDHIGWIGPYDSGEDIVLYHTWTDELGHTICAKTRDIHGSPSPSSSIVVWMTKGKTNTTIWFLIQQLLESCNVFL